MPAAQSLYMRPVDGSGQTLAVAATTATHFTNVVPEGINVVAITFNATANPTSATAFFVRIGGTAAAANKDFPVTIPTTGGVPTIFMRCAEGDQIGIFSQVAGTAFCCWMTA